MTRLALESALAALGWAQQGDTWQGPAGRSIHLSDRGARCEVQVGKGTSSTRVAYTDAARFAQESTAG